MDPVVRLRSAVCLLDRFPALAGVDLEVACGEVVLLSGPNGAGKTTLLRALAGLVPFTGGEATVLGHDVRRHRRAVRPLVGLLGHQAALYDDLTAAENVRFWARAAGRQASAADETLERVGCSARVAALPVGRLSAGQRRRVGIASLVARDPALWLLDEPHAGLDVDGRNLLDGIVRAAVARGATVLLVSHELERSRALADRAVILAGGTVQPDLRLEPAGVA